MGKPAEQDDQSLNRLDGTVPSPPSSLFLSWPTAQRQETQNKSLYSTEWALACGSKGAPKGAEDLALCAGRAGLGLTVGGRGRCGATESLPTPLTAPHPMALNKQKGTLYNTKYTGKSFPPGCPQPEPWTLQSGRGSCGRKGWGLQPLMLSQAPSQGHGMGAGSLEQEAKLQLPLKSFMERPISVGLLAQRFSAPCRL